MKEHIHITPSNEDYLEAILHLEKNGSTRSVDVAKELGVTKPAVSVAASDLIAKGLITKEAYSDIVLTEAGRQIANNINTKHLLIKKFLLVIGATEENAEIECCKVEHIFSDHTMSCIEKFCKENPLTQEAE
ncbi:MAG: metal-dependent transcriptional regulator [Bacillota bacterium]